MLIYLASPYSSGRELTLEESYKEAEIALAYLIRQSFNVWSPIVQCHHMARAQDLPKDAGFWKSYNLAFIERCDEIWVLCIPGWNQSEGVRDEMNTARGLNKTLRLVTKNSSDPERYIISTIFLGDRGASTVS